MSAVAAWWAYVLRYEARELWRALPGPQDEILLMLIVAACRKRKARRELAAAGGEPQS